MRKLILICLCLMFIGCAKYKNGEIVRDRVGGEYYLIIHYDIFGSGYICRKYEVGNRTTVWLNELEITRYAGK